MKWIILHQTDDRGVELAVMINLATVSFFREKQIGHGTVMSFHQESETCVVNESLDDILAKMKRDPSVTHYKD